MGERRRHTEGASNISACERFGGGRVTVCFGSKSVDQLEMEKSSNFETANPSDRERNCGPTRDGSDRKPAFSDSMGQNL